MSTKTCKCCGWVYPASRAGRKCKVCGYEFETYTCNICGKEITPDKAVKNMTVCRTCYAPKLNEISRRSTARKNVRLQARFDDWLEKVQAVPKDYPTLTEEQWLAACKHFDGCARCHCDTIDARGFFISTKLGGRYCDWNIIPLCEKCTTSWDLTRNVFKNAESRDFWLKSEHEHRECLEDIVDYLGGKLDAAIGISKETEEPTD